MNALHAKKFKILIVDDSPKNIQVVAGILKKENVEFSFALNGKTALLIIESEAFDLILLDIMMPEMNGYELCEILKKNPVAKDIPVIFLTAKTDTESIIKGFESGGVDYIVKPFNPSELLARVKTHLSLKQAKESLEKANCELKQLNAAKDKFFSIIAHDLRNPFTGLFGVISILLNHFDSYEKEKIRHLLELLDSTARHIFDLLENLLNWSRSQTDSIKRYPEKINLNSIISKNIRLVSENAGLKQIRINNKINAETFVYADENMIKTVIRNLLTNAIKFTEKGGNISISSKLSDDMIEVSIADTGVGIKKENIDKLFRIDVKYNTSGTAQETGTGLGLNVCKEFIELNGGAIWLESEAGKGSTFYFTIPKS